MADSRGGVTRLKPHSRFGWRRDERLRPRSFLLQVHAPPTRLPVETLRTVARSPAWASVHPPGDPTCRSTSVHGGLRGAGHQARRAGRAGRHGRHPAGLRDGHALRRKQLQQADIWFRAGLLSVNSREPPGMSEWGLPHPLS